jgi:pimeloyl-ACP methyl ester carboxylesterase
MAASEPRGKTHVLVHGAWHGAWCWQEVARALRSLGHHVTTPTQTGVGERKHLMSKDITLDTFVADIVDHIETEGLRDVILVGHSLGGASITGAADRIPDRIRHLVYLDGAIIESGQSVFSTQPPDIVAARREQVRTEGEGIFLPCPPPSAFGIPDRHPLTDWVKRHLTPQPAGTFESTLRLDHPVGNGRPRTYITCTNPPHPPAEGAREWAKKQSGWNWQELATGHDAMILAPAEVVRLLDAIR